MPIDERAIFIVRIEEDGSFTTALRGSLTTFQLAMLNVTIDDFKGEIMRKIRDSSFSLEKK